MAKLTDVMGRPHSGLVPWAVVGIVTDNVDPDELGRIQVKFPTLHQEPLSFWLRQIAPNAGKERGLYALPEVDDEVLVIFMQGSHDIGVIVGQFWNGVDIPPTECKDGLPGSSKTQVSGAKKSTDTFTDGSTDLANNDRRFWKSRSGHLLVFDDTSGSESVQIWDSTHSMALVMDGAEGRILLTNTSGDLHIRTAQNLYLEAGMDLIWHAGQNIDGESGMDTLHKAGMNYELEAGMEASLKSGMDFNVEAGMNLSAKATMNATVEGTMNFEGKGGIQATLQGSAMAVVKGGVVMIN